jgi:hypothetical protein
MSNQRASSSPYAAVPEATVMGFFRDSLPMRTDVSRDRSFDAVCRAAVTPFSRRSTVASGAEWRQELKLQPPAGRGAFRKQGPRNAGARMRKASRASIFRTMGQNDE